MTGDTKGDDAVDGNCIRCDRRTRHAIRYGTHRNEYLECVVCGNKVDVKAFVYDNLDALSGGDRRGHRGGAARKAFNRSLGVPPVPWKKTLSSG